MHHHTSASALELEWTLVSAKRPCTICGSHQGCRRGFEDEFVCCTRVRSEWPLTAGGWVHRVELGHARAALHAV
jgi:hypothetical protein